MLAESLLDLLPGVAAFVADFESPAFTLLELFDLGVAGFLLEGEFFTGSVLLDLAKESRGGVAFELSPAFFVGR